MELRDSLGAGSESNLLTPGHASPYLITLRIHTFIQGAPTFNPLTGSVVLRNLQILLQDMMKPAKPFVDLLAQILHYLKGIVQKCDHVFHISYWLIY